MDIVQNHRCITTTTTLRVSKIERMWFNEGL